MIRWEKFKNGVWMNVYKTVKLDLYHLPACSWLYNNKALFASQWIPYTD